MYAQVEKPKENKSMAVANSVAQKKSNGKQGFGFVDNRPEATVQKKMQMKMNYPNIKQLKSLQEIPRNNVIQLVRPSFSGPARKAKVAGNPYTGGGYDLAHRISFYDIETIVNGGNATQVHALISAVTIPQRAFGKYPVGYQGYYNTVKSITDKNALIRALNNSPFNLRPGDSSTNRSIGAGFDANVDDSGAETPQSTALRPHALTFDSQNRTSSYLLDPALATWESHAMSSLNL